MRIGALEHEALSQCPAYFKWPINMGVISPPGGKTLGQMGHLGGLVQLSYSWKLI